MLDGEELSLPGIDFICFFDCLIIFAYASIPMHHRFLMMECGAHSVNIQIKGRVFFLCWAAPDAQDKKVRA